MTPIETVWARMKATAAEYASAGAQLAKLDAHKLVMHYMRDACVSPWPPADVIEFFAQELLEMSAAQP